MEKTIKVKGLEDIKRITSAATTWFDAIEVTDAKGSIANAKSILGLLALDYSKPVSLVSENPDCIRCITSNLKKKA